MDGILPIWKPPEITSYDVIRAFKRNVHPSYKVGHGGTLDPFAEGVLLLLLGKATKKMNELSELPKTYRATAKLGAKSETLDRTGVIVQSKDYQIPTKEQIEVVAKRFVGEIEQEIPDYSATKIGGVPRYKLARKGTVMEKKSKIVTIHDLKVELGVVDTAELLATVSSGTYIRQLSYDIFNTLGIESYLSELVRIKIGEYEAVNCATFEQLKSEEWQDKLLLC